MNLKQRILVVYIVLIVTLTAVPGGNHDALFAGSDKVVHTLMFFVLGMVSSWTFPKKHVMVVTGGLLLALGTEMMQLVVPQRSFDWWDLVADGAGLTVGWAAFQLATRFE